MDFHRFAAWSIFALMTVDTAFAAGSVYSVNLAYESGRLSLLEMHVMEGFADSGMDNGSFECRIVSADGIVTNRMRFSIPTEMCYDELDNATGKFRGGCKKLDRTEFVLFVPNNIKAKTMEFYDDNNTLTLSADLSKYSDTARSKIMAEEKCADGVCVQGQEPDKEPGGAEAQNESEPTADLHQDKEVNYIYISLSIICLMILAFIFYWKKQNQAIIKQREDFLKWKEEQERLKSAGKPQI